MRTTSLLFALALTAFAACGNATRTPDTDLATTAPDSAGAGTRDDGPMVTATYVKGNIDPEKWTPGEEALVSIDGIPTTETGFLHLRQQLGGTPQGAVVLQIVAFEMMRHNREAGKAAIALNNTETNCPDVLRTLPDRIIANELDDATLAHEYLPASFFLGATPENAFNPTRPLTVRVRSSKVHDYQEVYGYEGPWMYLEVYSEAWDTHWRGCEVVQKAEGEPYRVGNCPAMYVSCKNIPSKTKEKFRGL